MKDNLGEVGHYHPFIHSFIHPDPNALSYLIHYFTSFVTLFLICYFPSYYDFQAFGIPFIKTAFGHRPDLAYILAPLLIYAPAQLLLGSTVLVPAMSRKIKKARVFEDGGGI